ncbi:MAG: sulfatase [Rhizobiales bacterium NRL2]|nr:MAG: sulfatase [Rhizobiales bacterium NRL2]
MNRRNVLLITTDQQRHDALGCTGGRIARTPVLDRLAGEGVVYDQARNQNVVCMPARSTILTGQHIRRHGVVSNGIPLPEDAPHVARILNDAGYATALIGKAHFEPASHTDFFENRAAAAGNFGPHRGFDRMELAGHTGRPGRSLFHYPKWLADRHPDHVEDYYQTVVGRQVNGAGGGDTGAPQVWHNPIPRDLYHTDWTADRAIDWLESLAGDAPWFLWLSFPDPHHPWDPPQSQLGRVNWRDLDLPAGYPGSAEACRELLAGKPRHWLDWYEGRRRFNFETPPSFRPADLTPDQIREIDAVTHVENELIDEAVGRVMDAIGAYGWDADTDVLYTTDHGEFQGDFGMLFKGPYHVDSLMRVPMFWRPAPSAGATSGRVAAPVGHVDLAPTICAIAGLTPDPEMQGAPLPLDEAAGAGRACTFTEWHDRFEETDVDLVTMTTRDWIVTVYEPGNYFTGEEGELYDLANDPRQWFNLWDDPGYRKVRDELVAALRESMPAGRAEPLEKIAPV